MRKIAYTLLVLFSLALVISLTSSSALADGMKSVSIGDTIPDFKAKDLSGKEHTLASLRGKNGTVLIFISVQCPISNAYNERMEKLAQDYAAKGINVVGINSNATEPTDAVKQHAAEHNFTFTIIKDKGNKIADQLGAEHTPEAYLLDANDKLLYHGRIDNQKDAGRVTANDLRDAIEATLAGQPVKKPTALAFGCTIKRAS
jgi:peroxiredoxin